MSEPAPPWSVPVKLADIGEAGRRVTIEADAATRAALAGALGVGTVQEAGATFDLSHWGRDGLHVAGRVTARVGQSCVVTLEPVVNAIDEEVDVDFAPDSAAAGRPKSEEEAPSSIEGPEPLIGDSIDVGALATEYLILGVDPYPRKPGIAFDAPKTGEKKAGEKAEDAAEGSPFAALAALKKGTVKE